MKTFTPLRCCFALLATVSVLAFLSVSGPVRAQDVTQCNGALVRATYNKFSLDRVDYRLAVDVDEATYDQVKHDAGGSAVVYGVPGGGNYADYHSRAQRMSRSTRESLTREQILNIQWTGLDPNARSAYSDCLNSEVFASGGLHLVVSSATEKDISLWVKWVPVGSANGSTLSVKWTGVSTDVDGKPLPSVLVPGDYFVVIPRPSMQRTIAVNGDGRGHFVVVAPLPLPPPPPERIRWAPKRPQNDGKGAMIECVTDKDELIGSTRCTVAGDTVHTGCWPNDDRKNTNSIQMCRDRFGDY